MISKGGVRRASSIPSRIRSAPPSARATKQAMAQRTKQAMAQRTKQAMAQRTKQAMAQRIYTPTLPSNQSANRQRIAQRNRQWRNGFTHTPPPPPPQQSSATNPHLPQAYSTQYKQIRNACRNTNSNGAKISRESGRKIIGFPFFSSPEFASPVFGKSE